MQDKLYEYAKEKTIRWYFSSVIFLIDIILWLLNINFSKYIAQIKSLDVLVRLIPNIIINVYNLPFWASLTFLWITLKFGSKYIPDKYKDYTPGWATLTSGFETTFKNYTRIYKFLYMDVWTVLIFFLIIGNNVNKIAVDHTIFFTNLMILALNVRGLVIDIQKLTYDIKLEGNPQNLSEVLSIDEENKKKKATPFWTIAQKKVGEKEYRIIKNILYKKEYRKVPNYSEDKYFVVCVKRDGSLVIVDQSTNWDEIKYSYEQLISTKEKKSDKEEDRQ